MAEFVHRSPGLTAVYNAVKISQKNRVLDLGPCVGAHLEFYSRLGAKFHFDNFNESVGRYVADDTIYCQNLVDECVSTLKAGDPYDIVLLWDLLNFVPLDIVVRLFDKLKPFIKPNTLFHVISYVGASVPSRPCEYRINDQYSLSIRDLSEKTKPHTRLTTANLLKALPHFSMLRSFINSEGMVSGFAEQILSYEPVRHARGAEFASAEMSDGAAMLNKKINSPALIQLYAADAEQQSLLDLGRRNGVNYDAWKRSYSSVFSDDLAVVIKRFNGLDSTEQRDNFLQDGHFLRPDKTQPLDVIIAWDLFNYIPDDLLAEVGRRLVALSKNGTRLVVMSYSGETMPSQPLPFVVSDKCMGLVHENLHMQARECAPLTSLKIQKALPGFFVQETFASRPGMLRGMSEYVFVFKDEAQQAQERKALYEQVMARRRAIADAEAKSA